MKEASLIREYEKLATTTSNALSGLNESLKQLNDTNVLHAQSLDKLGTVLESDRGFKNKLLYVLVIAVIMLAGLEKFRTLIGI